MYVLPLTLLLLVLPMTVKIATVRTLLNTSLGTQDITSPGVGTPKAAIFVVTATATDGTAAGNAKLSMGFTDGTRDRCVHYSSNDNAGTTNSCRGFNNSLFQIRSGGGTLQFEAAFSAWITDGIRINLTTVIGSAWHVQVTLIGGDEPQVYCGTITSNASIGGTTAITAPGFEPHTVFLLGAWTNSTSTAGGNIAWGVSNKVGGTITQRSTAIATQTAVATSSIGAYFSNAAACKLTSHTAGVLGLDVTSHDANGFTGTTRDEAVALNFAFLAVRWGTRTAALSTVFTPTSTGADAQTWPNLRPQALISGVSIAGSQNSHISNQNAGGWGAAIVTPTQSYCTTISEQDNVATTQTQTLSDDQAVNLRDETGAALVAGTWTSMDATGYTFNYPTVAAAGRAMWVLAVQAEQQGVAMARYRRRQMGVT